MNQKALQFIRNVCYAMGANVSRILTTFCLMLLLPRLLSVEDYSYWQLYGFYGIYLSHSSIGWCEGTYLKYGGRAYECLDQRVMASQFWGLALYEALFMGAVFILFTPMMTEALKIEALVLSLIFTWFYILRYQVQTILQAVGHIRGYAGLYTGERILNFILVLLCLAMGKHSFGMIASMEILSNGLVLFYGLWQCRDLLFQMLLPLKIAFEETKELIGMGYKLTLAGLASQLIIGIVRFAIEQRWGTIVFGKISLSLSMANMLITCIGAVSIVLFPLLRNVDQETMETAYKPVRRGLTMLMFGFLLFYQPVRVLLGVWLPQYADSIRYLAILFPLCIYETRNTAIVWTYLKALRKEGDIMKANVVMVAVSAAMTLFTVGICGNLEMAVISIVALYAIRAVYTEEMLLGKMSVRAGWDYVKEGILTAVFIASSWLLPGGAAFIAYFGVYVSYLWIEREKLKSSADIWKQWMLRDGRQK